jgi:hypothetical protein
MTLKIAAFLLKITYICFPRASGSEPEEPTIFCILMARENAKNALKKPEKGL